MLLMSCCHEHQNTRYKQICLELAPLSKLLHKYNLQHEILIDLEKVSTSSLGMRKNSYPLLINKKKFCSPSIKSSGPSTAGIYDRSLTYAQKLHVHPSAEHDLPKLDFQCERQRNSEVSDDVQNSSFFTLTFIFSNGLKMGKVFKSDTQLLILDPEVAWR